MSEHVRSSIRDYGAAVGRATGQAHRARLLGHSTEAVTTAMQSVVDGTAPPTNLDLVQVAQTFRKARDLEKTCLDLNVPGESLERLAQARANIVQEEWSHGAPASEVIPLS